MAFFYFGAPDNTSLQPITKGKPFKRETIGSVPGDITCQTANEAGPTNIDKSSS